MAALKHQLYKLPFFSQNKYRMWLAAVEGGPKANFPIAVMSYLKASGGYHCLHKLFLNPLVMIWTELRSIEIGFNKSPGAGSWKEGYTIPGITIYPWNSDLLPLRTSLNSAISSSRNRSYSGDKVIPGIRHIYTSNRVILPFRNWPLFCNNNYCYYHIFSSCLFVFLLLN